MLKVFVLAVIAAACSSVAFAGEVKQTKTVAPVVKATTMSDSDMDKVTAGFSQNQLNDPTPGSEKNLFVPFGDGHSNGRLSCGGANRIGFCTL
jgi:hypothetical protein